MRGTFANIYLENLKHNIHEVKRLVAPDTKMCVAVKADAYGHGAIQVAKAAVDSGVQYLAVAAIAEGIELRKAGITVPILVLSLPLPTEFDEIISYNLTPAVFDSELIELLATAAERHRTIVPVHLKIDTGMGRIGCVPDEAGSLACQIASSRWLHLEGVFSHLSVADSTAIRDEDYTHLQIERFCAALSSIQKIGVDTGICHIASSAASLRYPDAEFDMIRPGLAVYGYYPGDVSADYLYKIGRQIHLKPVMELCSTVVAIKRIKAGQSVSYGRTWVADEDCYIGVLPVGYADGLLRHFGQHLRVAINGREYHVCGRICMDQCMIYLGNGSNVSRWDTAVIFGPDSGGAIQNAADIAYATGTIPYEITCGIDKRVPRVYK